MEDKAFELIEKLYVEMQKGFEEVNGRMDSMEQNMATKHDIVRLENKMDENHKALYDGYKLTYEKLTLLEDKVDEIDKKV